MQDNRAARLPMLGLVMLAAMPAAAQELFDTPDPDYRGRISAWNADLGKPFLPGATLAISGTDFSPGQKVQFSYGLTPLLPEKLVADQDGRFEGSYTIPADAPTGNYQIILTAEQPYHAEIIELKISPEVPLTGAEKFVQETRKLDAGLYQSAYSAKIDAIFVSAAVGYPPITESGLMRIDPATLEITARGKAAGAPDGGLFAVYGLGLDDANGTIWVTNTRQDTVAVYAQEDLSLLKQFEPGLVPHSRDAVVDEARGKVYVSANGANHLAVFDAAAMTPLDPIPLASLDARAGFNPASLWLDRENGKLFAVNLSAPEVAIIDTATDSVERVLPVQGARAAIGVSHDPQTDRIFVAAQGSDNLLIVDAGSGETLHDVTIGAGPLNVVFDPASRLAYVSSRGAGTITVVDPDGEIIANLENAPFSNHVMADGKGAIYAVNKSRDPKDPQGDRITRITLAQ